jgi:hypothetical protein
MRLVVVMLCTVVGVCSVAQCDEATSETSVPLSAQNAASKANTLNNLNLATEPPKVKFQNTTYDLGDIKPESKNVATYTFTNVGKGKLKILDIQKTCGCTPFELAKREYLPGESGTLKVEYQATKQAGAVLKHLYVMTDDSENSKVEIVLKSNIVIAVAVEPRKLNLSLVAPDVNAPTITIHSKDNKAFSIKNIESTGNTITADFDPNASATNFVLKPKVNMEVLKNNLNGFLKLHITHPDIDELIIGYTTPPEIEPQPATLIIRNAVPLKTQGRELWIKDNYNRPFEIESVSSKNGCIKVVRQEKLGDIYKLTLEITPPEHQKTISFSDTLTVHIKGGNACEVSCRGLFQKG